jgi:isochorismate synthase
MQQISHSWSGHSVSNRSYNCWVEFLVEELADHAGVAVDTIRYYQRQQLLNPPRRSGRRALYGEQHLERLRQIRGLAEQGFSLAQIRELAQAQRPGLLADLAAQNAADPTLDRAELARRADVPEFIVDVVVSAGLLTPVGEGADQRFAGEAIDMLVAARTLVSEGVSLEELTSLAMRHATHVEDLVDDAIELFKRSSDRQGRSDEDLAGLMRRLVPVASQLVGQHFDRTLRSRALARLGDQAINLGGVVVCARRLDHRIDPIAIFVGARDHHRSLWVSPDDQFSLVGLGAAETIQPHGDTRFSTVSAARAALAARIRRHGPSQAPAPLLIGGFSFACGETHRAPDWSGFPDARWILPEVTVIDRPDGSWLLAATSLDADQDEAEALDMLERRLEELAAAPVADTTAAASIVHGDPASDDPAFEKLVAEAVAEIKQGRFDKVVVARVFARTSVDQAAVLRALVDRFPNCATFAFGVGQRTFLGASPEQLVTLNGTKVSTAALAGTVSMSGDADDDAVLAQAMLNSPKIRAEHRFVVDQITDRLATLGLVGETCTEPEVMRLARVQHLRTPITAQVERRGDGFEDMDVLRVAAVLHPTSAVGGSPSEPALAWLSDHEGFNRGWYAAPVGWCDLDGNGEIRVALRSALVDPDRTLLFAGAGIVADSDPAEELAETGVKLRALLDVMEAPR